MAAELKEEIYDVIKKDLYLRELIAKHNGTTPDNYRILAGRKSEKLRDYNILIVISKYLEMPMKDLFVVEEPLKTAILKVDNGRLLVNGKTYAEATDKEKEVYDGVIAAAKIEVIIEKLK